MKDGLSINADNKTSLATSMDSLAQAYAVEREKAARRKLVRQLASPLCMVFHINPNEQALVITLSNGSANNNLGALKCWIELKLDDENTAEEAAFLENELARALNDITSSM
jgi:hypothetical protein